MEPFRKLTGVAAVLLIDNIDTDVIIPAPWVVNATSSLGKGLFGRWRYVSSEEVSNLVEEPEFVLNQPEFRNTKILIAAKNFGCGSSREHAVWALLEFGIRCVIAESFGDIFYNNCLNNGLLPVRLPEKELRELADEVSVSAGKAPLVVDLEACIISTPESRNIPFDIDPGSREALLQGLDLIDQTLQYEADIQLFQAEDSTRRPWVYRPGS